MEEKVEQEQKQGKQDQEQVQEKDKKPNSKIGGKRWEIERIAIRVFLPVCAAAWEIVRFKAILIIFARATFFLENENEKVKQKYKF